MTDENNDTGVAVYGAAQQAHDNSTHAQDDNSAGIGAEDTGGEGAAAASGDDAAAKDDKDKKSVKAEKQVPLSRFLKQNAELQEARKKATELQKIIEASGQGTGDKDKDLTPDDIKRLAKEEAARMAATQKFNEKTDEIYNAGVTDFTKPEFDGAIDTIRTVGAIPADMIDVLHDLGDGHKVLKHLSDDLDLTERLFSMSATKRAIELTKLHGKVTAAPRKQISQAPEPVKPLGGTAKAAAIDIYDPKLSTADRIKEMRRQDQLAREKKYGKR